MGVSRERKLAIAKRSYDLLTKKYGVKEEDIYWQAKEGYKLTAFPSDTAQGGFFHTDQIALIDQEGKIRGYYDGTSTKAVDQLFTDLHLLLKK